MTKQADLLTGLSREQYLRQQVALEGFSVLEEDSRQLLQWVTRMAENLNFYDLQLDQTGNWGEFWKYQLPVILTDLVLLDTEAYREEFLRNKGTGKEREILEKLERFIRSILERLNRCGYNLLLYSSSGNGRSQVWEELASGLIKRLEEVVSVNGGKESLKLATASAASSLRFFGMLDAVVAIRAQSGYYWECIVKSGEMEPALAVLYIFLKNYTRLAAVFNQRLGQLPVFYLEEILKSRSCAALPDRTWITLNKTPEADGVVVPEGTAFAGGMNADGTELHYLSVEQLVVTDIQLDSVYSVLLRQAPLSSLLSLENYVSALYRQRLPLLAGGEALELFGGKGAECERVAVGWMMESPMFDLREGVREVELYLSLTPEARTFLEHLQEQVEEAGQMGEAFYRDAFIVKVCSAEGWLNAESCVTYRDKETGNIVVRFVLNAGMPAVVAGVKEVHRVVTQSPAIQMVLNEDARIFPYSWASQVSFESLTVKVKSEGITNLKMYSEYGELDASVPFYPFGVQAKKGAWFVFGNYEMACKPVTQVKLSYHWQQLPAEDGGFREHYADYHTTPLIDNLSFEVRTEWLKDKRWVSQLGTSFLFEGARPDGPVPEYGEINFWMDREMPPVVVPEENYALTKMRHGFLRVVLSAPEIGFGSELYRQLFAKVMIDNSRKGKEVAALPADPVTPVMSEVELAYEAMDTFSLNHPGEDCSIRFYQLKPLAWQPFLPVELGKPLKLAEPLEHVAYLLFAFRNVQGSAVVRFYFDMSMRPDETGFRNDVRSERGLDWYYNNGRDWKPVLSEQVLQENTNAFTQAGLIELALSAPVAAEWLDGEGRFWLCASVKGDYKECRLAGGVYVNVVEVVADGGNGSSLPLGSITQSVGTLPGIESVCQIVPGFGGCPPEDKRYLSLRMAHRIAYRGRALNPPDFERLALQQFPVLERVRCLSVTETGELSPAGCVCGGVLLVVMSREQGGKYPLCSLATLQDIRKRLSEVVSPFVRLEVRNPVYEKLRVHCRVKLATVVYAGATLRKLQNKINFYIAPWLFKNQMPELNQGISLQGLYTILVNEADVDQLSSLQVERVDEGDDTKKYRELSLLPEAAAGMEEVWIRESVCGGVFIPDENHVIEYE